MAVTLPKFKAIDEPVVSIKNARLAGMVVAVGSKKPTSVSLALFLPNTKYLACASVISLASKVPERALSTEVPSPIVNTAFSAALSLTRRTPVLAPKLAVSVITVSLLTGSAAT